VIKQGLIGLEKMIKKLGMVDKAIDTAIQREVKKGAVKIQRTAVLSIMRGAKNGKIYTDYYAIVGGRLVPVKKRAKPHRASAPGQAPATDSGTLAGSIVVEYDPDGKGANIIAKAAYAKWLEFGTDGKYRIAPRPFMKPAHDQNAPQIMKDLKTAIQKARGF
jgi:HK97 gp10 family phage protein